MKVAKGVVVVVILAIGSWLALTMMHGSAKESVDAADTEGSTVANTPTVTPGEGTSPEGAGDGAVERRAVIDPALEAIRRRVAEIHRLPNGTALSRPIEEVMRLDPGVLRENASVRRAVGVANRDVELLTRRQQLAMYRSLASALRSGDFVVETADNPSRVAQEQGLHKQSAGDYVYTRLAGAVPGEHRVVILSERKGNAREYFAARRELRRARARHLQAVRELAKRIP